MGHRRRAVFLMRDGREDQAFSYTGRVYDLRGVPPGGLTRDVDTGRLFPQAIVGRPWYGGLSPLTRLCLQFVDQRACFVCHIE